MPRRELRSVYSVNVAILEIIPYLEDTGSTAHKAVYFDGWDGLAASAVLRAIAEDPPPSLKKKFDKILHIDCSRWKSRRALQRAIADKLELPQSVMTALDREDEEDDFSGVDEGSRAEVADATRETYQTIRNLSCLVIFHNGSDSTVDLSKFGFPQFEWFSPCTVLWTFRGRLRLNPEIKEKVDSSHMYIYQPISWWFDGDTAQLILDEATEIVKYIQHKQSISPEIAAECISYLLWLNEKGGGTMEYNWATHASSYWVCDGIIEGGQSDEAWEVSAALHQQIRLGECSSHTVNFRDDQYTEHWESVIYPFEIEERTRITVSPTLTSFFLTAEKGLPLPHEMFQQSERLRVLKLSGCNFSFYSPPFRCCRNLRFLGLDSCKDQRQEEEDKQGRPVMGFFQSLWVLDVRNMDWELDLSQDITWQMAINMREVHIKKGKIWRSNLSWRQLKNLRKLRVIGPISSWETGKDEFMDMVKLELLDLSGNNTIQVLPSLCGANTLKTLVLDGCAGLEHVGPEGLPPSLESFSFDAGAGEDGNITCKVSRITLAGCAKLLDFKLLGSVPNLVELDLSGTAVKILDLKKVVQVQNLRRIFLTGCKQLRSIVWPANGMQQLRLLCIDTRQEVALFRETSRDSLVCQEQERCCHAHVWITDIRFLQSLGLTSGEQFCWISAPFKLNLYLSCTSKEDGKNCNKLEETVCPLLNRTGQVVRSPTLYKNSISMACCIYNDISIEDRATENDGSSALRFEPQDLHIEMGQGITGINVVSAQGIRALRFTMNRVLSLHVHDCSSITTTIPREIVISTEGDRITWRDLKCCHVERCPKLDTVFHTNYDNSSCFHNLETLQATGLLMARSIWSKARPYNFDDLISFAALRAIHLHLCPRLQYVLPLPFNSTFSSLETLYIVRCGDLRQVFPGEEVILSDIATRHRNGMLEFPRLKHLYLHDLFSLQQICEAKMFAPELKAVRIRDCWGLRRLPATDPHRRDGHLVAVDCEKDWWENLEWDGLHVGHGPSLFEPRHSAYYKKRLLRTTVLW
ncbi:unnamed protein product [Urochloa decumbens]|uniref:Disease resistance protein At4g27190-like leucine-rich repeats domain-containing protein n=1 Tax=Urochloa decumbens TaxID=240449 RepID=A0ABC9D8S7_9POAL